MPERIVLLSLACAAFVVTLGISSWHEGLWHSSDAPTAHDIENARRTRALLSTAVPAAQPARPFAPAREATATAAAVAAAPIAPAPTPETLESAARLAGPVAAQVEGSDTFTPQPTQSEAQSEPSTSPEVDNGEMYDQIDRAARRGARSH